MATTNNAYKLFDTQSPMMHGVSPQTGQFHTYIPIASLVGNDGMGPVVDVNLFYSPNLHDLIFKNWALRFTYYLDWIAYESPENNNNIYLSNGESWELHKSRSSSPNFIMDHPNSGDETMTITRKDGTREILKAFEIDLDTPNNPAELATYFIPIKILSPSGHSIILNWDEHKEPSRAAGLQINTPRLKSINDETKNLLNIDYLQDNTVVFKVHPDSPKEYSREFTIANNTVTKSSLNNMLDVRKYSYIEKQDADFSRTVSLLEKIEYSSGLTETLIYDDNVYFNSKIEKHITSKTKELKDPHNIEYELHKDIQYTYNKNPGEYSTIATNSTNGETIEHYYDTKNQQTKEVSSFGDCKKIVETEHQLQNEKLEITTRTTFQNKDGQTRTEVSTATLDAHGNLIAKTENGVTTEWTYYRGAPKEETLVKTETFNDASGVHGVLGWIGDNLNPIGWINQAANKQGLTWGTREIRTDTHDPYCTQTGKTDFNLPVDIICPGDPNYFRVYVESEKVYTQRDGKREDLRWTFYGYSELPVKSDSVKGPAVKPSVKLTVHNPDTDGLKLKSWKDGAMTLETTDYYTDTKDPAYGRVKTLTQSILDAEGKTVELSKHTTSFQYSLGNGQLTTTSTQTAEKVPTITSHQITSVLTGEVIESTDSFDNKTAYSYDAQGRLEKQIEFDQSDELRSETRFEYKDNESGHSIVSTLPGGEQSWEYYDKLGRLVSRKSRIHVPEQELELSSIAYDAQGRKIQVTEKDYRPDGTLLFSQTGDISYDEWGNPSETRWSDGRTVKQQYDPVARKYSEETAFGGSSHRVETVVSEEPGGGEKHEDSFYTNGNLTHSRTSFYDAFARLKNQSYSNGPSHDYGHDAFGRWTSTTSAGVVTTYDYPKHLIDQVASAASVSDGQQSVQLSSRTIDSLGRVTGSTTGNQQQHYTYTDHSDWGETDARHTDAVTQSKKFRLHSEYDKDTRKITETLIGGISRGSEKQTSTCSYTYSVRGLLLSATDAFGNTTDYTYAAPGRLASTSSEKAHVGFTYDENGRLTQETLTEVSSQKRLVTTYTFDEKNRETQREFTTEGFAPLTIKRAYNDQGRVASTEILKDSQELRKEIYTYNEKGQLTNYQCSGESKPSLPDGSLLDSQTFEHDLTGNITKCTSVSGGQEILHTYNLIDADPTQTSSITQQTGENKSDLTLQYDGLGFLTSNNSTLKYNDAGKLAFIQSIKGGHYYFYDSIGRLAGCDGDKYYDQFYYKDQYQYARNGAIQIDGENHYRTSVLLNESNACTLQEQIITPNGGTATTSHSFEIKDVQGTVIASYDLSNDTPTFFAYTPFGYRPDDWTQRSWGGFNGQPIDRVSGCYHLGNGERVYNPIIQRFQSPDSLSPFSEGGPNRYSYCHNDPVNFSDPSGFAEVIQQYSVVTHAPGVWNPVVRATMDGVIGIALAPFTGGASVGWAVVATGLAIVSAGFGIASAAIAESDPELSKSLGWASLGTGLASAGVGIAGAKLGARAALAVASKRSFGRLSGTTWKFTAMGSDIKSFKYLDSGLSVADDVYKGGARLNISAHGAIGEGMESSLVPVSYTHLTLPTKA